MSKSKNFGAPSRSMSKAARHFCDLDRAKGGLSHSSVATITSRVRNFEKFAHIERVKNLEAVTPALVEKYGRAMSDLAAAGAITVDHAKNCVSAINTTMRFATGERWISVAPGADCDMPNRSYVLVDVPGGIDRADLVRAIAAAELEPVGQCLANMARDFGLRAKETALIEPRRALKAAEAKGQFSFSDGTKGGKPRVVLVTSDRQFQTLREAVALLNKNRNFTDTVGRWTTLQQGELRDTREALQPEGIARLHDLRAAFACSMYRDITGVDAPVITGKVVDRALDHEARVQISRALGHGRPDHDRIDVVVAYIGSSK